MELRDIELYVAGQRLLAFDHLHVPFGQIVTLLGASGAGKSSLLKAIAGVQDPDVVLKGYSPFDGIPAHRRRIGYVDQHPVLFPHLNVLQNVSFGLKGAESPSDAGFRSCGIGRFCLGRSRHPFRGTGGAGRPDPHPFIQAKGFIDG